MKDKGLYRWPPHINLLYPFVVEAQIPEVTPEKKQRRNSTRNANAGRDEAS
jgi:hypothetical protein